MTARFSERPIPVETVADAIRCLRDRGEDRIYEVDVITAFHPEEASEVRRAFRACIARGYLEPSASEPCAFVPRMPADGELHEP